MSVPRTPTSNITPAKRMQIVQCYWQRQALDLDTSYVSIADEVGVGWRAVKRWINKIPELMSTGCLQHAPRSGRKKHIAFRTEQKMEESMDILENLAEGEHKRRGAQKLGCCEKTIYNRTKGKFCVCGGLHHFKKIDRLVHVVK